MRRIDLADASPAEVAEGEVAGKEFLDGQALVDPQAVQRGGVGPGVRSRGAIQAEDLLQTAQ